MSIVWLVLVLGRKYVIEPILHNTYYTKPIGRGAFITLSNYLHCREPCLAELSNKYPLQYDPS